MEIIDIEGFLNIRKATIELKRINIFIGPQAQGKSIISKLVAFFKEIPQSIVDAAIEGKNKRELCKTLKDKFENMFPKYGWEQTKFNIRYSNNYFSAVVACNGKKLQVEFCERLSKSLSNARNTYRKILENVEPGRPLSRISYNIEVRESVVGTLFKGEPAAKIENVIYMPAGRSFFSIIHKHVFSFISANAHMDYFIKSFGAIYEQTREIMYSRTPIDRPKSVSKLVEDLICGHHYIEKGQDWIRNAHGKVNVASSSSGQQESLPLALILSFWPYIKARSISRTFIIEEPEAHLFPVAQAQVVSLIASAYSEGDLWHNYIVTTHSPYILTAFNIAIQAGNVKAKKDDLEQLSDLHQLVPFEQSINFDTVSAYYVDAGIARPILNNEHRLINADEIDAVSNYFSEKFEKLLDMEF